MARRNDSIKDWAKIRKNIVNRDDYKCRMLNCDRTEDLNVHHIDYDRTHNADDNLVTLCRTCHRQVHSEGYKPCLFEDWPVPWGNSPPEEWPIE